MNGKTSRGGLRAGVGLAVLSLVVVATALVTRPRPSPEGPPGPATPRGAVAEPTAPVRPAPMSAEPTAASAAAPATGESSFVASWSDAPTEEPRESPSPEDRAAPPRATRAPQPCVEYTWDAADSTAAFGQLLVEIRVRNECGRVLESLDVMFRADAMRGGDVIYSGHGNLLERLYPGSVRTVMIALPGSTDSFDRVAVAPINPPVR